jgi:hypothetical protein
MLSLAAAFLFKTASPDFVQPIVSAPVLIIQASLGGHDALLGIDTGSEDLLIKPTKGQDPKAQAQVNLSFLSSDPITAKVQNFPSAANAIVGLQYLQTKAVGVDVQSGAFSVWNYGNITQDKIDFYFSHAPGADSAGKPVWQSTPADTYQTLTLEKIEGDNHYFVEGAINGTPVKFGLDTDSAMSAIDQSAMPATGFTPVFRGEFGGLKGDWHVQIGFVDSLAFGTDNLKAFPISEVPPGTLKPAQGLIGFDAFQSRRVLIDFPARKLYLGALNPTPAGPDALVPLGIRLAPFVDNKQYIGVIPDSPAAKAGLVSGDQLVEVNGKPISANNFPTTHSSLADDFSKIGIPKSLTLAAKSKSGVTKSVELKME